MLKKMPRRVEYVGGFNKVKWAKKIVKFVVVILGILTVVAILVPPTATRVGHVISHKIGGRSFAEYLVVNDGWGLVLNAELYLPMPSDYLTGATYPRIDTGRSSTIVSTNVKDDELISVGIDPRAVPDGYTVVKFRIGMVGAAWMFWMNSVPFRIYFDMGYPPIDCITLHSGKIKCNGLFGSQILDVNELNVYGTYGI